jgi:hypothetical protein
VAFCLCEVICGNRRTVGSFLLGFLTLKISQMYYEHIARWLFYDINYAIATLVCIPAV